MLKLHVYGPYFGLPDGSPFCIKALMLMKMSGLPFEVAKMSFKGAPKGKAPYLNDNGQIVADSHFIMRHLETAHKIDFSGAYGPRELATGWALCRMLEEHLYFLNIDFRWLDDENFAKGPIQFFAGIPAPLRPLITAMVRRKQRKTLHLQGLGRHTPAERTALAISDIQAVEDILGDRTCILGEKASFADASAFPFLWAAGCKVFRSPVVDHIHGRPRLVDYLTRMQRRYFPEFPV